MKEELLMFRSSAVRPLTRYCLVTVGAVLGLLTGLRSFAQQPTIGTDSEIVRTLAPELTNVRLATMDALNQDQQRKLAKVTGAGFRFQGDFDSDGRPDMVLLGQHGEDRRRSFLLIARVDGARFARAKMFTFEQEFLVGRIYDGRLAVFFCTGCDDGGSIEWTGSDYVFRPFSPPGVE